MEFDKYILDKVKRENSKINFEYLNELDSDTKEYILKEILEAVNNHTCYNGNLLKSNVMTILEDHLCTKYAFVIAEIYLSFTDDPLDGKISELINVFDAIIDDNKPLAFKLMKDQDWHWNNKDNIIASVISDETALENAYHDLKNECHKNVDKILSSIRGYI